MVIFKWINSLITGNRAEIVGQAAGTASDETKKKEKSIYVDVANAAYVDGAKNLDELIAAGSPQMRRRKMKSLVKKNVERVITDQFSNADLVEEITETITDIAEIDPYYKNLFGSEKTA